MISEAMKEAYKGHKIYEAEPIMKEPLLDKIDSSTLIAWFRCNSCYSCKWRKEVLEKDPDPNHDIFWCADKHEKNNIVDMVRYLGYTKE